MAVSIETSKYTVSNSKIMAVIAAIKNREITKRILIAMDISEKTADMFYWIGNIAVVAGALVGLIGAAIGLIGGIAVVWGDKVRERFAESRMSANERETITAKGAASDALRLQQATEIRLNETKVKLALTQRSIGPRRLSHEEMQYLLQILTAAPKAGAVCVVAYMKADREASDFAADLVNVMVQAKITVDYDTMRRHGEAFVLPNIKSGIFYKLSSLDAQAIPAWFPFFKQAMGSLGYTMVADGVDEICPQGCIIIDVEQKPKFSF